MKTYVLLAVVGSTGLLAASVNANTVTFVTPAGATTSGGPVDASAEFTTSSDVLTITLSNLQANPTDVAQLISDLSFGLNSGQTSGSLSSSSGLERTVAKGGAFTDAATPVDTGWALTGLQLSVLGTPIGPGHLIIGGPDASDKYSNANGSIADNPSHNPFLAGAVAFTIDIPGLTSDDSVNSATFSFGTTAGIDTVNGIFHIPEVIVPDGGTTVFLLGAALSTLGLVGRKLASRALKSTFPD
jgi:hypothetical protein